MPDEDERTCPWCGSTDLARIELSSLTGVISPDGISEGQVQIGFECLTCGKVEPE